MTSTQALYQFWSSFGLSAYDETSVDDKAELPYLTYESPRDDFGYPVASSASLWYRSTSWVDITAKEVEIAERIGRGGIIVSYDGGALWIKKGNPWAQRMSEASDDMIRRIVLNVELEFID